MTAAVHVRNVQSFSEVCTTFKVFWFQYSRKANYLFCLTFVGKEEHEARGDANLHDHLLPPSRLIRPMIQLKRH